MGIIVVRQARHTATGAHIGIIYKAFEGNKKKHVRKSKAILIKFFPHTPTVHDFKNLMTWKRIKVQELAYWFGNSALDNEYNYLK